MTVAVVCVTSSTAATPSERYYVDQNTIANTLVAKGFTYNHRHIDVYSTLCRGRGRYGFRTSEVGVVRYWRFKCDVLSVSQRYYTLDVSTTLGPNGNDWYWHILSARFEF